MDRIPFIPFIHYPPWLFFTPTQTHPLLVLDITLRATTHSTYHPEACSNTCTGEIKDISRKPTRTIPEPVYTYLTLESRSFIPDLVHIIHISPLLLLLDTLYIIDTPNNSIAITTIFASRYCVPGAIRLYFVVAKAQWKASVSEILAFVGT